MSTEAAALLSLAIVAFGLLISQGLVTIAKAIALHAAVMSEEAEVQIVQKEEEQ